MKAIEFENVGKQYRLGLVSTGTFSHDLNRWWVVNVLGKEDPYLKIGETNDRSKKGNSDFVWALRDINFSVEQGDVVGIIGKNGAGKSTLLKLLSRVTSPTNGLIRVNGRISSLLEVGTGFHPEMTGRENIYMNGAIMGMSKAEVKSRFDEIVDFSGCERYIDTPVKRYSSGMKVRLGFAVAAHLEPEILVVDEVLAVGDAEFQKKAIGKMQDVSSSGGRTVLFVSHNMASVKNLCRSAVLLSNGTVQKIGDVDDIVNEYISYNQDNVSDNLATWKDRKGNGKVKFQRVFFTNEDGEEKTTLLTGGNYTVNFELMSIEKVTIDVGFSFFSVEDVMLGNLYSSFQHVTFNIDKGKYVVSCKISNFPFASRELLVRGVIKANGVLSDWPSCHLAKIEIEKGDFYETGVRSENRSLFLFKGEWSLL